MGKTFHPDCFVCSFCSKPFGTNAFIQKYERPYCKACDLRLFGNYCKGCNSPIDGTAINALNANWHPEHFQCSRCRTSLTKGVYVEKNSRPFCNSCAPLVPNS